MADFCSACLKHILLRIVNLCTKISSPNVIIQDYVSLIGHKPGEVGTRPERSWESGWASDVDRIPGLEAVEMQTQAEALWRHLSTREPQVNSLCGRIFQPSDAKRLRPSRKHNWEYVVSKYTDFWLAMWWQMYIKYKFILLYLYFFFPDIDDEWQKTQCMPRETCIDVAKELGTNTAVFFKPPCVSVFRCGGCCNKEGVTCRNTSMTYVNKTVSTTHCIAWVLHKNLCPI